jgi:membrane AbrB-like protein
MSAAESLKTDNKRIAISQSMRVIILVEGIPLLSLMLGYDTSPVGAQAMVSATLAESALLIAVGVVGGFLLDRTGLPGGIMIGAVLSTGALYLTGVVDGYLPRDLMIPVVITLGAIAGTRLRPGDFGLVLKLAMPSFVAFAITVGITMSAAVTVSMLVGIDLLQVFLAFAPGAVDALLVIAFALDADPAYVVAHHVVRILLVAFTLPFVIRWISRHS